MKTPNTVGSSKPETSPSQASNSVGKPSFRGTGKYAIKLAGHLDQPWSEWLGGLKATHENDGTTVLSGTIPDQSALHGILIRIRNLGLTLVSVSLEPSTPGTRSQPTGREHPAVHFRSASLGQRLKAFAYDYLLILAYIVVLAGVNYGLILSKGMLEDISPFFASPWIKDGLAFLTLILPVILYFTFFESGPQQASWGKRRVGLRVVAAGGGAISRPRAFLRNIMKFLPWQLSHTSVYQLMAVTPGKSVPVLIVGGFILAYGLAGTYLASILLTKMRRTPYDRASWTRVVRVVSVLP